MGTRFLQSWIILPGVGLVRVSAMPLIRFTVEIVEHGQVDMFLEAKGYYCIE